MDLYKTTKIKKGKSPKLKFKFQPKTSQTSTEVLIEKAVKTTILFITTYPPRQCGIATYSEDLIENLKKKFSQSFTIKICPIIGTDECANYQEMPICLNTQDKSSYVEVAKKINTDDSIDMVIIQHEFGLFYNNEEQFLELLKSIKKTKILGFHTVLPRPDPLFLEYVQAIMDEVQHIIVMTKSSKDLIVRHYNVDPDKVQIIHHGTHLVKHIDTDRLKKKFGFENRIILSTFGLLGPGKSIETTLKALPKVIEKHPSILFLIIGKTHPNLAHKEGEQYREYLTNQIIALGIQEYVTFINEFVPIDQLLDYLQLTDIYLFTSNNPNQAVSGTFSYAMSCGCPIISTPIPHALEFLTDDKGLIFDFGDSKLLTHHILKLIDNPSYRKKLGLSALHSSASNSWENAAIAHAKIFDKLDSKTQLKYDKPALNLNHLKRMTSRVGIIQFSVLNHPDMSSGYTLDDNARALIVLCHYYKLKGDKSILSDIKKYLHFILSCQRFDGTFLNYVNERQQFTKQNSRVNLDDSNGRAIWALGYILSLADIMPEDFHFQIRKAENCLIDYLPNIIDIHSPRAIAFLIKGLQLYNGFLPNKQNFELIEILAYKLTDMYRHESRPNWQWFERYLTYGNSVLPEAMLAAWEVTKNSEFKKIAVESFDFLLKHLFYNSQIRIISNQTWFTRGDSKSSIPLGGQQSIDVAYTILALRKFHSHFPKKGYDEKMEIAFSWFLGNNHLNQIVYNPCTNGCYDGIETTNVNLNQGAESVISFLLARMAFEIADD